MKRSSQKHERTLSRRERIVAGVIAPFIGAAAIAGCSVEVEAKGPTGPGTSQEAPTTITIDEAEDIIGGNPPAQGVDVESTRPNGAELTEDQRWALDIDQYVQLDPSLRAADNAEYFTQARFQMVYDAIVNPSFVSQLPDEAQAAIADGTFYMPDFNKPRNQWVSQDYLNYFTLAMGFATGQQTDKDGLQAASVVANPGTEAFKYLKGWIDGAPEPKMMVTLYRALPVADGNMNVPMKPGNYDGVVVNEDGGMMIRHEALIDSGKTDYSFFVNYSDESGNMVSTLSKTYDAFRSPAFLDAYYKNKV